MSIYIAHHRKKITPLNALDAPNTVQKETSSVYDENSQFACPAHADCFGTSSISLAQQQRRCDGRTYWTETVEQRVDGGWWNEDADVQQLERPMYTAQTDNPMPVNASTCTPSSQAYIWLYLSHRANIAQNEADVSSRGHTSSCHSQLALQRSWIMTRCNLSVTDFGALANSRLQ